MDEVDVRNLIREEVTELIKDRLTIEVDEDHDFDTWGDCVKRTRITVYFDQMQISSATIRS